MTRAGRKQSLLTLQIGTDVVSATGAVSRTWATDSVVYADIKSPGGRESYGAAEVQNGQDVEVVIRWRTGLTDPTRFRFIFTSLWESPPVAIAYHIDSIADIAGTRRELVAKCTVRYSEGLRAEST